MTKPVLSPLAAADIEGIWDYTADTWNVPQADRYVADIRAACESLTLSHKRSRPVGHAKPGYRKLPVGSHLIIFRVVGRNIEIVRVLHARMDVPSHIED